VLELAALQDDKLFYFYDDLKRLDDEPCGHQTAYEDQIAVTEEVYCRLTFYNCRIRSFYTSLFTTTDGSDYNIFTIQTRKEKKRKNTFQ